MVAETGETSGTTYPVRGRKKRTDQKDAGRDLGFEATLWAAADKVRGNLDSGEYKHVVLGLIFLKYISDAFVERHDFLLTEAADPSSPLYVKDPSVHYEIAEDRDEYAEENVFWVPPQARWSHLLSQARQASIG